MGVHEDFPAVLPRWRAATRRRRQKHHRAPWRLLRRRELWMKPEKATLEINMQRTTNNPQRHMEPTKGKHIFRAIPEINWSFKRRKALSNGPFEWPSLAEPKFGAMSTPSRNLIPLSMVMLPAKHVSQAPKTISTIGQSFRGFSSTKG